MKHLLPFLLLIFYSCSTSQKPENTKGKQAKHQDSLPVYHLQSSTNFTQTGLSDQFYIISNFKVFDDTMMPLDSCILMISVLDKRTKEVSDTILLTHLHDCYDIFSNSNNVRSYATKLNVDSIIVDNYAGDIVVADFNFDKKDDIAIFSDCGGNGGPTYRFYIQTDDKKFRLERYLTDTMEFFPQKISKAKQQLTTYVHAGACCLGEHVFQYYKASNRWKEISHKTLKVVTE